MKSISAPFPDSLWCNFADLLLAEDSQRQKVRPKTVMKLKQGASPGLQEKQADVNRRRKIWTYLTLGIPLLFETISLFYSGVVRREKLSKPSLELSYDFKDLMERMKDVAAKGGAWQQESQKISQLIRFNQYNQKFSTSRTQAELVEATQMMGTIINEAEKAREQGDVVKFRERQASLRPFIQFLEKNNHPKMSCKDFDENDWAVMDLVRFEQAKKFFGELSSVFNSDWAFGSRLRNQMQANFNVDYYESVIAENLALTLAYIEGLETKTILLPVYDRKSKKYVSTTFKVKSTRIGDALPCYILESEDHKASPWLIVRGTSQYTGVSKDGKEYRTGGFESVLADTLDHQCIVRNVLNKSLISRPIVREGGRLVQKESIGDIFRNWKTQNKRVCLAGHSLGGAIVNALTVEFYDQVKTGYSFSSPGVSVETAERWESLGEKAKKHDLHKNRKNQIEMHARKLVNYDYEGDFIPSGGRRLIGNHLAVKSTKHAGVIGLYETHVLSHLNNDCLIQKVDVVKENHKLARYLCEKLRIVVGKCFRFLLGFFNKKYVPDWWKQRHAYRKHAKFERAMRKHL